jgi:hypothetical protein
MKKNGRKLQGIRSACLLLHRPVLPVGAKQMERFRYMCTSNSRNQHGEDFLAPHRPPSSPCRCILSGSVPHASLAPRSTRLDSTRVIVREVVPAAAICVGRSAVSRPGSHVFVLNACSNAQGERPQDETHPQTATTREQHHCEYWDFGIEAEDSDADLAMRPDEQHTRPTQQREQTEAR